MNARTTCYWVIIAAVLLAIVSFRMRFASTHENAPPNRLLPGLHPGEVTSVQVRFGTQAEVRVERTNDLWTLTRPIPYPAQSASIEALLSALERAAPALVITPSELKKHPKAEEEYGFTAPQASILLEQSARRRHVLIGGATPPGDQVFVQVNDEEGVYVVDADLFKVIPRGPNDWRDTTFLSLKGTIIDRISVTNSTGSFGLAIDGTNHLWRMSSTDARADNAKIADLLDRLGKAGIRRFITDDPAADLDALGLQTPDLQISLAQGSNVVAQLQFGKIVTNAPLQVYARRVGQPCIVTVPTELTTPWRGASATFRDPHLVALAGSLAAIEVRGKDSFQVEHLTNGSWQVVSSPAPEATNSSSGTGGTAQVFDADPGLVRDFLLLLGTMQVRVVKEVVTAPDLPAYGLDPPAVRYILKSAVTNAATAEPDAVMADIQFGATQLDSVYVKRADEPSVGAVSTNDFLRLPKAAWELRQRRIWDATLGDVTGATIRQQGRMRQLVRSGAYSWSLGSNSQGIINVLAVEETVRGLLQVSSAAWVARGDQIRARYGIDDNGLKIELELRNGSRLSIEFGGQAPSGLPYAGVKLGGQTWVFEFPLALAQDVVKYLSVPASAP